MLESTKRIDKRNKTYFINSNGQSSHKDLFENDKKIGRSGEKKNKTMKELKSIDYIEVKEEKYNKFSLGQIKNALIHQEATKPLKKIKDLTKKDLKINSCPCCGLPTKIDGKLEDYKMCDSPDTYSNCGDGVILYFSFFKFCIIVSLIATIGISFFDSYISYNYHYELQTICANFSKVDQNHVLHWCEYNEPRGRYICFNKDLINSIKTDCKIYSSKNSTTHELYNTFFFKVSLVNFRNYRIVYQKMINILEYYYGFTIINLNFVNFICLVTIFIVYLAYIFFIFNKSNAAN